ncbi:archaemetzincin family Zn-dependent metalloprotease [Thermococcus thioreducens]|uniref:Archaemetzincin n=1 Tax=Thermococcus thioreducens TaxID=277988 RepID=A0A0Q2M3N9_9EURY|nr:archaemetzincin family Zn-dependent metalloprotease [Thermococcus thioreducens]ASJ12094.1 archemetzincin [Thermococcus thioreducens]KQH82689.1 archemetzincin [Thermococcus thioreducens]SEW08486.1 archaemetzincin [Thermococcus thioreducens]
MWGVNTGLKEDFPPLTRTILLTPIGAVEEYILGAVTRFVDSYYSRFGFSIERADVLPEEEFLGAYNPLRRQYIGRAFLSVLRDIGKKERARAVLGITRLDLYEEGLNFIFGLAHAGLRTAIVSTFRLRPEFYGEAPDKELYIERTIKESMHELGHVFGLPHCPNKRCVMHFSNSIIDTDIKDALYCPTCLKRLGKNLGEEP